MTRFKALSISFLVGVLVGSAVPAHAAGQYDTEVIDSVNTKECTITLTNGDMYQIDCDELDSFRPGEEVTLASGSRGYQSLVADDDTEAELE